MARVTEVKAVSDITVTDVRGRVLTLKKPNVLAQYQLVELLGATSENRVYLAMVLPLLYLQAIDGEAANFSNRRELDALIQRMDEDGLASLQGGIAEHFAPKSNADVESAAKKSQGTQD